MKSYIIIKYKFLLIFLAFSVSMNVTAQKDAETNSRQPKCKYTFGQADIDAYNKALIEERKWGSMRFTSAYNIPVKLHIVRHSNGNGTLNQDSVELELARANTIFAAVNVQFFQCQPVEYIDDNAIWNTNYDINESLYCGSNGPAYQLTNAHNMANVVNIYWVNTLNNWNWATFPSSLAQCADKIMMNMNQTGTSWLLAHELGHYFNLLHTHETAFGAEHVTRTSTNFLCYNCNNAGDQCCDTPADPNSWNGCNVNSGQIETCATFVYSYAPNAQNIMSYANGCQQNFSSEQISRIVWAVQNTRSYISCPNVSNCNINWNLSGNQSGNYCYQASDNISSNAQIATGSSLVYTATNQIILTTGFIANNNSTFKAKLQDCYNVHIFNKDLPNSILIESESVNTITANLNISPNPFSDKTIIEYFLSDERQVDLRIYNLQMQLVKTLISAASQKEGKHSVDFNADDLPNGIYLCRLHIGNEMFSKKLVITK